MTEGENVMPTAKVNLINIFIQVFKLPVLHKAFLVSFSINRESVEVISVQEKFCKCFLASLLPIL
jgi:hypothetical protein